MGRIFKVACTRFAGILVETTKMAEQPPMDRTCRSNSKRGCIYVVLYRWRLHPGSERTFIDAWSRVTRSLLTQRGSLGSRLHRGSDGIWYGYAQWPSAQAREGAFSGAPVEAESMDIMRRAISESFAEVELEPCADFLVDAAAEGIPESSGSN